VKTNVSAKQDTLEKTMAERPWEVGQETNDLDYSFRNTFLSINFKIKLVFSLTILSVLFLLCCSYVFLLFCKGCEMTLIHSKPQTSPIMNPGKIFFNYWGLNSGPPVC
jgi:hypothetical protein